MVQRQRRPGLLILGDASNTRSLVTNGSDDE